MTAVGYISDSQEIIKASWSNFQYSSAAAFKRSERSQLPPAASAKDLPRGRTHVLNVGWIRTVNHHPAERDEESAPDGISDTENWVSWYCHFDNPMESKDDCGADDESNIEPGNAITPLESPEHHIGSTTPGFPGLIWPTRWSMKLAEKGLVTVRATETIRNKGNKKK